MNLTRYNKYLTVFTSNLNFIYCSNANHMKHISSRNVKFVKLGFLSSTLTLISEVYDQNRHETVFLDILDSWIMAETHEGYGTANFKITVVQKPVWLGCE